MVPTELTLTPGQTVKLRVRLFDDKGRFIKEETGATWTLERQLPAPPTSVIAASDLTPRALEPL